MKISCSKSVLMNGINIVSKAVSTKSTMQNLQCILIEVNSNEIHLIANDIELGIETIIDGTIIETGRIALDAKFFSDVVNKLPDSEIVVETNANFEALIKCERSKIKMAGTSGEDFNYLPEVEKNKFISLSQFTLKEVIRQTIFSISKQENTKIMTGELFEINGDILKVLSLDGHRISIRNVQLKESYDPMKVIVPGKTLTDISKILNGGADDEVLIYMTDKHILFEFNDTKVVSRLIEGEFYNIDRMMTDDYETKFTINKKEFLDCIDRASIFIKESDKRPIVINIEDSSVNLKIDSSIGSMNEEIEIKKEGKDLKIAFTPKYLMDVLHVIDDDEVDLYMINALSPCFIRNEDNSYIYLVLPVDLGNA